MRASSPKIWHCGTARIALARPQIMGIVNVTPDSFSDGGLCWEPQAAVAHGLELLAAGADILDVGGESTRPGAAVVDTATELRRVVPVIAGLAAASSAVISIDTTKVAVAQAALAAGAQIINCVMPLASCSDLVHLAATSGAGLVAMHMRGTPATMSELTTYVDVVAEVESFLSDALSFAQRLGVKSTQLVIDPGIGFAKNCEQNLALLRATARLSRLAPMLVGVSRKRFIGEVCAAPLASERLGGSVAAALWCAAQGASILRVHDVGATHQALKMTHALAERASSH